MLKKLNPGAVVLDLSVDYPNPIETCKPTTLTKPWFKQDNIFYISIYGYPGLVPISSVNRYSKQILPLVLEITNNNGIEGIEKSELGKNIKNAVINPDKENTNGDKMVGSY
jgi:alanine dehydrogenase